MNELVPYQTQAIMPVMNIRQAVERRKAIVQFTQQIMQSGVHYGKIPGTTKDTLLKPGAEMLTTFFGLSPRFVTEEKVLDWTGTAHDGEPFFHFQYRCQLWRGDIQIGEGLGSCNSWEKKYRYRKAGRTCPECGTASIMRSKYPPRGAPQGTVKGWYCRDCKTDYPYDSLLIQEQETGRVLNDNPADLVNTIDKMAQKRALVAATLIAVNASEFFTQDMEDFTFDVVEGTVADDPPPTPPTKLAKKPAKRPAKKPKAPSGAGNTNGNAKGVSLTEAAMKAILDAKHAENPAGAARMVNLSSVLTKDDTPEVFVKWAKAYRAARDADKEPAEAAKVADAAQAEGAGDGG